MSGNLALLAVAALANASLGVLVLWKNPASSINRYFAVFSFSVASWTLSNGLVSTYAAMEFGYLWARLAFASASVIPIAFLLFTSVFPTNHPAPARRLLSGFTAVAVAAFIASFTPLLVKGTSLSSGSLQVIYGPLHLPFGVYFISCFSFSLFILIQKLSVLTGLPKLQVRYLLAAVGIAALGATVTNLLIPLIFDTSKFSRYGPLFGLPMIAIIAHAIIRYRLMDITVVIRKGVVYVSAISAGASVFFLLAALLRYVTGHQQASIPAVEALLLAVIVAILFQPLKRWIQLGFDRYVYREVYDYPLIIREASKRIGSTLDLSSLLRYLCDVAARTLRPDMVAVYVRDKGSGSFALAASSLPLGTLARVVPQILDTTTALPAYLLGTRQSLLRDEFERELTVSDSQAVLSHLRSLGAEVAFPILAEQQLFGFLLAGPKMSGDAYFNEDIDLLSTLLNQVAIAVNNAQLYRQVLLANEHIENILRTMDSGVITVDAAGQTTLCNSTAERLTGLPRPVLTSLTVDQLPSVLGSQLRATLTDGHPRLQIEMMLPDVADRRIPVVSSTSALTDAQGSVLGAVLVFSDLSKIKALEHEKRRAERLASFGALAKGFAHEIKNPLVAIKTFAELLPERFTDADFREDFSKVVMREIARIDDLVARLRGIAAPVPEQVGATDVREPLAEILELLRGQLEHYRTTVRLDLQDNAPFVPVDHGQLKQLLLNLFMNSLEAMGSGGEITFRATRRERHGASWIVLEVSDSGPGIPESIKAQIFEPFFTTKPGGSGLGLAISRGIVDAHRGLIRAESGSGIPGTTIIVEFPAATRATQMVEQPTRANRS